MIPVKVLAVRYLANAAPALCRQLGAPEGYPSLGLLTTDCDDATYIALDPFGTATNVTGDGAIAAIVDRIISRRHRQGIPQDPTPETSEA